MGIDSMTPTGIDSVTHMGMDSMPHTGIDFMTHAGAMCKHNGITPVTDMEIDSLSDKGIDGGKYFMSIKVEDGIKSDFIFNLNRTSIYEITIIKLNL